jgi:CxxC motif-containing protein (DUF1111 family)
MMLGQPDDVCQFFEVPNDTTNLTDTPPRSNSPASDFSSDAVNFAAAIRLSDIPQRQTSRFSSTSISNGQPTFDQIGCNLCHSDNTAGLRTVPLTSIPSNQGSKVVPVFSDLALHHMGTNLQDNVSQGLASGDQFRSAPLWGLGARLFLLHDGRTQDLVNAITQHLSPGSEANTVINNFNQLTESQKQDLLNFLRSL